MIKVGSGYDENGEFGELVVTCRQYEEQKL